MTNSDVADILEHIADILELTGENRFKYLAYRKAAGVVESLPQDINEIADAKKLEKLPGIGAHIAERLEQLLKTGRMTYYEEIKSKVPPGLVELTRIRGFGPKSAVLVYETLGITTVAELEEAAKAHKLKDVKGLGAKTEENILRNISQIQEHGSRILLAEAYPIALEIVENLRYQPFVVDAEMAGSLRRMQRTIGDIDLLASSNEIEKVMDYFTQLPAVLRVEAKGKTKSTIVHRSGRNVDLRVVAPSEYGSALQYFTGSKEHSVHLRGIAKDRGYKISEYGIFDVKTEKRLGGTTEDEIYSRLDLPVFAPELREDKGEIEAAYDGRLPNLITPKDIKGDLHTHTKKSDGLNSLEDMVKEAKELGYSYICISDHAERLKVAGGLSVDELKEQIKRVADINKQQSDVRVLVGIELNIDNEGNVDYSPDLLAQLDFIGASIHAGFNQSKEQLTQRMLKAINNPFVNLICHPTAEILNQRAPYQLDMPRIFDEAAKTGTILELNSYPNRLDLKADYLREAKRRGVKIAINTDAHNKNHLLFMFYGVAIARRGWLEKEDVVNTWPLKKLLNFAHKKRK